MKDSTFITRVVLKNYKSIAAGDVRLHPLVFLVGPNGAGKSNFLDALRFVADALRTSLDHALRDRSGIKEVRRRSGGHPTHFGMRLEFRLKSGAKGHYAFRIGAQPQGGYEVQNEECRIYSAPMSLPFGEIANKQSSNKITLSSHAIPEKIYFRVIEGQVNTSLKVAPAAAKDRLYLVNASGLEEFRPVYEAFSRMAFYNLNPDQIRRLQTPDAGEMLARDGRNLASVLAQLKAHTAPTKHRIEEYLEQVVPGIKGVDAKVIGPMETLEFRQQVAGSDNPWRFLATNMSDGTLRALGILVALFQASNGSRQPVPLVGIEEPEVALHPAAAGALVDSLLEASRSTQVIITSHSPELLDNKQISSDSILAVVADKNVTQIAPVDEAGRSALRDHLYTAGELLRLNQLVPDPEAIKKITESQPRLFDGGTNE
jgi:predicted ATPase